jgi:TonB family protein
MSIAERASLAVPILVSLVIHALVITVGEAVSRRGGEIPDAPLRAEYRLPDPGGGEPPMPREEGTEESAGATISLEAPDPAYRPYFKELRARIGKHWQEPELGDGDRSRGTLLVEFTLEAAGELRDVSVARSSGVMGFDFAAVEAVKGAASFPPFPPEIQKEELTIQALFVYE